MIVNARMYSATPQAKAAWKTVLAWVLARARLQWTLMDYDAPAPLSVLWARDDLGATMMCGLPYSQRMPPAQVIASPVPSPGRYENRPVYFTDIVVRADAPYRTLEDTFGGTVGYTLEDSMSGYVAFRRFLRSYRSARGTMLYRKAVGGLVNARQVIEAVAAGRVDVGPLDSYYFDLMRRSDPEFAAGVRVLATTDAAPIPPLVATGALGEGELGRLRSALLDVEKAPELELERDLLLLKRFAVPPDAHYRAFDRILEEARQFPDAW
ncbi:MAG: PhnD/SsuA/transferrin family substrate-binding protein [Candidatus Parcubacteria bacterium]|nr:PhnD/SsuA/transferrin family substrate-binding protein [Burkholderiales bacterium]